MGESRYCIGDERKGRSTALLTHSGPCHELIPVPFCTLGRWHPDAHRAVMHTTTVIASRAMIPFETAREFLPTASRIIGSGECKLLYAGMAIEVQKCTSRVILRINGDGQLTPC